MEVILNLIIRIDNRFCLLVTFQLIVFGYIMKHYIITKLLLRNKLVYVICNTLYPILHRKQHTGYPMTVNVLMYLNKEILMYLYMASFIKLGVIALIELSSEYTNCVWLLVSCILFHWYAIQLYCSGRRGLGPSWYVHRSHIVPIW